MTAHSASMSQAKAASSPSRIIGPTLPPMSKFDLVGWKLMGLRNRLHDQWWERRLHVNTTGRVMIHKADAHLYATFAYASIFKILERLDLKSNDVFVDIGCGKGRVVCCAATFGIRKAIGVDLDRSLCDRARENASAMRRRRADIDIIHAPAQEVDYREGTRFFLFNPFGETTLRQVLDRIQKSLVERPRTIDVVYVNPVHDDVLEAHPTFTRYDQWRWTGWSGLKHDVSFWGNRAATA